MQTTEPADDTLEVAFETFNQVGRQLTDAYEALQRRVAVLTEELARARSETLDQLREKERLAHRLQRLVEVLPGGVLVLDDQDRVQLANTLAREIFGERIQGRAWRELLERLSPARGNEIRTPAGRWLSLSSRSLGAGEGRVLLLADVTEGRRIQEMASRNERLQALGEMAARLAHQIRTPLASLLLYLSQLGAAEMDEARRARIVASARERLRHLERTVDNMLAYARGAGDRRRRVAPAWLLTQFRELMAPKLQAVEGVLEVVDDTDGTDILGDGDALLGALVNLGVNAVEAGGVGVRIRLEASCRGDALCFVLEDDGPGIPKADLDKVTAPFYTTRPGGTGLGLAVVKAVVESLGGGVRLENRSRDGLRVTLTLPTAPAPALPSGAPASERTGELLERRP